ncbi:MAG: sensor histidine kinase [Undibacterium sp.]|nr:sensor histidine kinase [Opitutaceae bacterium]
MPLSQSHSMDALCDFLAHRREAILQSWWELTAADQQQTTKNSLTRGQFNDHIPQVLDAFERKLRARPGGAVAAAADEKKKHEEVKHGLHRWQQGYRLQELMREWGHLQRCIFEELNRFATAHPEIEAAVVTEANRQLIALVSEAIGESTHQYERMEQAEAAGHVGDLRGALQKVSEIERHRAAMIHQVVHDLHSNVFSVNVAVEGLGGTGMPEKDRMEYASLLKQGVHEVSVMLGELMDLARLEAGQERRELAVFDVAALISDLVEINRPLAASRRLFLNADGLSPLRVEGDATKVRRLSQNLVMNALKYTSHGGVTVTWGAERDNWWLIVADTGPGLTGSNRPLAQGLIEATASARESDEHTALAEGESSNVLTPAIKSECAPYFSKAGVENGEGIGLSIVKRLCELLDASLEVATSSRTGTTFRIVFPRDYLAPSAGGGPSGFAVGRTLITNQ